MPFFSPGDLLLKVDLRAVANTELTQHHVMLVLGESERGYPLVMHMRGDPHWALIEEELNHGKELTLLHPQWPEKTAKTLVENARTALRSHKFKLSKEVIDLQRQQIAVHRPDGSIDAPAKYKKLQALFNEHAVLKFNPTPEAALVMSCHEWVIAMIHHVCTKTNTPIPTALKIPPHLAWADRLAYGALQSSEIASSILSISSHEHMKDKIRVLSAFSFFSRPLITPTPPIEQDKMTCTIL